MIDALRRHLQSLWWRPTLTPLTALLVPLAGLVGRVARRRRARATRLVSGASEGLAVPVIVVGNLIVGGAGKTPTVLALVDLLRAQGWTPGIVSRGHGRSEAAPRVLGDAGPGLGAASASDFGDEPVLMHRRCGAPLAVGRRRLDAARALLAAHPEVDLVISDDGLQHHALPRDVEIVVFDSRGIGNGWPLPAGPLREWPAALAIDAQDALAPRRAILLNGPWPAAPARPLPAVGSATVWQADRRLGGAAALADWQAGAPAPLAALDGLRGRRLLAAAGIGDPERFFRMLEAQGLQIDRLPLPDHDAFATLPWPPGTPDVVVTEKDAIKLVDRPLGTTRVWVVPLDFQLPHGLHAFLHAALPPSPRPVP